MKKPFHERPFAMESVLLMATFFWGLSFIWCKDVADSGVNTNAYVAIRYMIAVLLMIPIFRKDLRAVTKQDLFHGFVLGLLYYASQFTQVLGLQYTTPANSSFITSSYVVMVPITSWIIMKQKAEKSVFVSIAFCLAGLYVLNFSAGEGLQLNLGNLITLFCAMMWSVQVTYVSYAGRSMKTSMLTVLPMFFTAFFAAVVALFTGGFDMTGIEIKAFMIPTTLLALFPTIGSGLAQSYAQKYIKPSKAAIIYTTESVIALTLSALLGYEELSYRLLLGGGLIISAILISEVKFPERKKRKERIS